LDKKSIAKVTKVSNENIGAFLWYEITKNSSLKKAK
jgi:hypothetical protein